MWVLPTFGRPERCQEALDCLIRAGTATPGIVIVNGDPDPAYRDLRLPHGWAVWIRDANPGPLPAIEEIVQVYPNEPWYGWLADDALVRSTAGWDDALIKKAGPRGIAVPDDGVHDGNRITWGAVWGGDLVRAAGWWMPPGLKHLYADDAWEMIGRMLNLWRFVPDVKIEHPNAFNGGAEADETHEISYSGDSWAHDAREWERLQEEEIPAAIDRIRAAFGLSQEAEDARRDRAKSRSVMICTPVYRDTGWRYTKAIVETSILLARFGIKNRLQFVIGSSNLPRARNELAEIFMRSGLTDLLFIDSDMGWDPNAVLRLLASDKEVVAAVGRKKFDAKPGDGTNWCVRLIPGSEGGLVQDEMGMIEVHSVGTGFLKIARSALEKIAAAHPGQKRKDYYRYFRFSDDDGGEDYEFCRSWREAGGRIWIDPDIELAHAGDHDYSGRFGDLLVVNTNPAAEMADAAE